MNRLKEAIINSLKWTWQFPQHILALFIEALLCSGARRLFKREDNNVILCEVIPSGFSLGNYIFIPIHTSNKVIKHECGHSRQSRILGPFYLIVIGIPSIIHNIIHTVCNKLGLNWDYYKFYTEHWLMNSTN